MVPRRLSTEHRAIVYGEDGELLSREENTLPNDDLSGRMIQSLSETIDVQSLTRIACAFAPPPHSNVHPNDVLSAHLVNLDATGIEIGIALSAGDGGGCVQLLVPVPFPIPCQHEYDDDSSSSSRIFEECLLENVQLLDSQAYQKIAALEWKDENAELLAAQQRIIRQLKEEPYNDELPDWWTFPELDLWLDEECVSMKDLLNEEDFAADLNSLFSRQLSDSKIEVFKVAVASIGPSGLFLRGYAEQKRLDDDDEDRITILPLAIQFDERVKSRDTLQAAVLNLVESVEEDEEQASIDEGEMTEAPIVQEEDLGELESASVITTQKEAFQRQLLKARLQYQKAESQTMRAKKLEHFQRELLKARFSLERKVYSSEDPSKATPVEGSRKEERVQRELLGARLKYEQRRIRESRSKMKEQTHRKLLESRLKYEANKIGHDGSVERLKTKGNPKSLVDDARLAEKYVEIEDIGERAYVILKDLEMV